MKVEKSAPFYGYSFNPYWPTLIRLQNDFESNMKKNFTSHLNFPKLEGEARKLRRNEPTQEENERHQVSMLDQWTSYNHQSTHRRSKIIKAVFRESMGRRMKQRQMSESPLVVETRLFLLRLDSELKKAEDINYDSVYKNLEFCSGIYENLYGTLLRQAEKLKKSIEEKYTALEESLRTERVNHIKSMEKLVGKENYKHQIPTVSRIIQEKEAKLEPVKHLLADLQNAKIVILKTCLSQGYDVREEGLLWILRELEGNFTRQDFPTFLNEKQVEFLMNRHKKDEQSRKEKSTLLAVAPDKNQHEIYQIVTRKKKREFTMTQDVKQCEQVQQKQGSKLNSQRHQLISNQVLRLAKQELYHTKATRYELIYKETIRKLNKFCSDQIHNKQKPTKVADTARVSMNTMKLLSCFQAKIEDYLHTCREASPVKQENALDEILKNLRSQAYHLGGKARNAVSVIACLLGWKKAKKIIENEMNSVI